MAKGLRSKVKTRYRTVKRLHVDELVVRKDVEKLNKRMNATIKCQNPYMELIRPPNKFLHPENEQAVIPQHRNVKKIDFRPEALPIGGLATIGNRRKYTVEEQIEIKKAFGYDSSYMCKMNLNKMIEDMHNRSNEAMKYIQELETNNEKIEA